MRNLPDNRKDISIAKTVITLGIGLDLKVIAEGVETETQKSFLQDSGCHEALGWLYGHPMSGKEFADKFLAKKAIH